jgi:hypothetical protein
MTMNRNLFTTILLGAGMAAFSAACSDSPLTLQQMPPDDGPAGIEALFAEDTPFNGMGGCMGNDVLSYNALVRPSEKASWSSTPIPGGNYCTAGDIYLASATVYAVWDDDGGDFVPVTGPITCIEGESFQVKVYAQLGQNAASARTDIGVWIGQPEDEGGPMPTQAVDGTCNHYNLIPLEGGVLDLDFDACGDMASAADELLDLDLGALTLTCTPNEANQVEVPSCIGWTVPGGDRLCPFGGTGDLNYRMGTVPVNTSKCNCEPFQLDITVLKRAYLEVRKELIPKDDIGVFDLAIDFLTPDLFQVYNQGHNGTTGRQEVGAGTSVAPGAMHTFAEFAGDETFLTHYVTTWECRDRDGLDSSRGSGSGSGPQEIFLMPDDDVVCTFTNVRRPRLRVRKVTIPSGHSQEFTFTPSGWNDGEPFVRKDGDTPFASGYLVPDTYSVVETVPEGWELTDRTCAHSWLGTSKAYRIVPDGVEVDLAAGEDVTCTFVNRGYATLSGYKWHDLNADGLRDPDEPRLAGWEITVWQGSAMVASALTGDGHHWALGYYEFTLPAGTYDVCEVLQPTWERSYPDPSGDGCHRTTLSVGEIEERKDFGNYQYATLSGYKWHDLYADGVWDHGEPALNGWMILATGPKRVATAETGFGEWPDGYYAFSLPPGDYTVGEICPADGSWRQSYPAPTDDVCGTGLHEITLISGQNLTDNNFGNWLPTQENDETAWAANGNEPGSLRYLERGNWATYVRYEAGKTVTLFAGQSIPVGTVHFSAPDGGMVTITMELDGWTFFGDMTNVMIQGYDSEPTGINPTPGGFDHKFIAAGTSFSHAVPEKSFYGVHAVVVED